MFDREMAKGFSFLGINYLFTLIGLIVYLNKKNDLDVYLTGSLLWAFIVIFIIIIIILSEGDTLSGIEGADFGISSKKKKA